MKNTYFILIPIIVGVILGVYLTNNFALNSINEQSLLTKSQLIKNDSPTIGFTNAQISIVEFGDYQCTFCYKFHQNTLNDIKTEYIDTGKANYVYRDFPLNGASSILAAEATYCANEQGKYWEYHNILYNNWAGENTGWINTDSLEGFGAEINLNISEFNRCLNTHKYYQMIIDNENYAKQIGINATPTFLIFDNDKLIRIIGAQQLKEFQNVINQLN